MSKRSTVNNLPLDVVIELKRRLRAYDGNYLPITTWLNDQGYGISKSSLGRYAKSLRESDGKMGLDREIMMKQGASLAALFEELAILKKRETEIIAQIKTASLFHKSTVRTAKK
ncbi:hypothetical protein GURASL_13230 [Geotalea uraniireducens]|uniref:Transposase n=1 Tax=Geotalea uraniireducens TaxID=351604 RepID=A0ABN6VQ58_9BACT|nr:phage protein Gp27 family protein [Geotalea uraniireducens]BDV42400.1 hypothetical protein GURASL_13230 [Geotalea uraniireducens]